MTALASSYFFKSDVAGGSSGQCVHLNDVRRVAAAAAAYNVGVEPQSFVN